MVVQAPDVFAQKTKASTERNARKKANKEKKRQAQIEASAGQQYDIPSRSGWTKAGPMVNGVWTETEEFPKGTGKWEDDPWAKAAVKTPAELLKEQIDENLKLWPWRQTVPRKLVTLVSHLSFFSALSILHLVEEIGNTDYSKGSISHQQLA